jgi:hypothetical protein
MQNGGSSTYVDWFAVKKKYPYYMQLSTHKGNKYIQQHLT